MSRLVTSNDKAITEAAEILKSGGLVGMPTETVYGLAANALDGEAVAKIYEAKGRPSFNPLISHYQSLSQLLEYVELASSYPLHSLSSPSSSSPSPSPSPPSFPPLSQGKHYVKYNEGGEGMTLKEVVEILADKFWPGPLTLILPRKAESGISELATAGLATIAVRVPDHPVAQALLKQSGVPIVAPSANKSGQLSPTTPTMVAESLGESVDLILAAGACKVGLESTVLDLSGPQPEILRPGAVTQDDIEAVLDCPLSLGGEARGEGEIVRSPGMLLKHYAPDTPVRLNAIDLEPGEALLAFGSAQFMGIKGGGAAKDLPADHIRNLSEEGDLYEAAANLFAMLKALDNAGATKIAVMNIPETGLGVAINDRLKRAAEG